jgi:flagellar protein FliO/FliZ
MDPATALTALSALAAVLGLVLAASRLLRRYAPGAVPGGPRRLALLEALPLDARRRLLLVSVDGRAVLLLTGGPQDLAIPLPEAAP